MSPLPWRFGATTDRRLRTLARALGPFSAELGVEVSLCDPQAGVDLGAQIERRAAPRLADWARRTRSPELEAFTRGWAGRGVLSGISRVFLEFDLPPRARRRPPAIFFTVEELDRPDRVLRPLGELFELPAPQVMALERAAVAPGLRCLHLGFMLGRPGSPARIAHSGPSARLLPRRSAHRDLLRAFAGLGAGHLTRQQTIDHQGALSPRLDLELRGDPRRFLLFLQIFGGLGLLHPAPVETVKRFPAQSLSHLKLSLEPEQAPRFKAYFAAAP
ncbi:MAG: hypothetical protein U1E65_35695 [Myxococcota bacterium]